MDARLPNDSSLGFCRRHLIGNRGSGAFVMDQPQRLNLVTEKPSEVMAKRFEELFPGVLSDGAIDAKRLSEILGLPVSNESDVKERFGISWAGRRKAVEALQLESFATLKPEITNSKNWDESPHVFIDGDNLEVLKLLQKSYNNKVKLIYIDPPYNTGNDFVYSDDFSDPLDHYLRVTGQIGEEGNRNSAKVEVAGRKHSNWLSMMYPRLVLARNLLRDDGLIAISIDQNEVTNLTFLMNEIFGSENQIAVISVVNNLKGRSDSEYISTAHEYLLLYSRGKFLSYGLPLSENIQETYKFVDETGNRYRFLPLRKSGTNSLRSDRPNMFFPIYVNPIDMQVAFEKMKGLEEVYPIFPDGREGCWRWGRETAIEKKHLLRGKKNTDGRWDIQAIDYLGEGENERRSNPKSIWLDPKFTSDLGTYQVKELIGEGLFDHPKPLGLIQEIIEFATGPGDLILDFFAGSGTTGQAVFDKNEQSKEAPRSFILVNLSEETSTESQAFRQGFKTVSEITKARLEACMSKYPSAGQAGCRYFRLAQSNFRQTFPISGTQIPEIFETTLNDDSKDEEIVSEIFLKSGLLLDARWEKIEEQGVKIVFSQGVGVSLNREASDESVERMLNHPEIQTLVFLEDSFQGRDALKANTYFSCKQKNKSMKTV